MRSDDPDVRRVMKQNLSKKRLAAAGPDWVERWRSDLGTQCVSICVLSCGT